MMDCLCHTARSYSIQLVCAVPPLKSDCGHITLKLLSDVAMGLLWIHSHPMYPSYISILL